MYLARPFVHHRPSVRAWARALPAALVTVLAAACLVGASSSPAAAATTDTIARGGRLFAGDAAIVAADGRTRLTMQSDGNLVLYSPTKALWSSKTGGRPGAHLALQGDGNMVVYDAQGVARWSSRTTDVAVLGDGHHVPAAQRRTVAQR